jgi:3'(2'), 5'-bisphosphate nucleotidase
MSDSPELRFALDAVRQASKLVRAIQREMVTPALTKADLSPVTVADYAAQALIGRLIGEAFPNDPLVGEEDAADLRKPEGAAALEQVTKFVARAIPGATSTQVCDWIDRGGAEPAQRFWTLDPIDGTKGFLRGEQYAVALALLEGGKVRLGVLGCPNLTDAHIQDNAGPGSLVFAIAGQGVWTTPLDQEGERKPLRVSDRKHAADARVLRSVESGHTNVDKMGELTQTLGSKAEPVKMDSQAKYAVLAAGAGDLLFRLLSADKPNYREKIWDQAAGSLVVQEAGGRITDVDGKPLDFNHGRSLAQNRGIAASNGHLHEAALAGLKQTSA